MPRQLMRVIFGSILLGCLGQAFAAAPQATSDAVTQTKTGKTYTIGIYGDDGRLDQPKIVIEVWDTVVWRVDDYVRGGYLVIVSDSDVDKDLAFKTGARGDLRSKPITFAKEGRVTYRAGKTEGVIKIVGRVSNTSIAASPRNSPEETKSQPQPVVSAGIAVRIGDVSGALKESPNKKLTVQATADSIQLVDAVNEKLVGDPLRMPRGTTIDCWAFSPDGKLIAAGGGIGKGKTKGDNTDNKGLIYVWDLATGRLYDVIEGERSRKEQFGYVTALAFNNDGTVLFVKAQRFILSGR